MYEQLRNEFEAALTAKFSPDKIQIILAELDSAMRGYDLVSTEKALVSYQPGELPALVKTYLASQLICGLSKTAIKNRTHLYNSFFNDIGKMPAEITTNDIRLWLYTYKTERNISDQSLNAYRVIINGFFDWAVKNAYLSENPCVRIPQIKYEKKERESLTQTEMELIRKACITPRDKALIEFLYSTGCRVSELVAVKKNDIDFVEKTVHLFGKGKKHRTSYLNAKAEITLKDYLDSRDDDNEYLFVASRAPHNQLTSRDIEKHICAIGNRANLPSKKPISPHIFRHTTATTALSNGMPINEIQQLLGHNDISTTMIYAKTDINSVRSSHMKAVV